MSAEETIEQVVPSDNGNKNFVSHTETSDTTQKIIKSQDQQILVEISETKTNGKNLMNNKDAGETSTVEVSVEETVKTTTPSEIVTVTTTDTIITTTETNSENETKTEITETQKVETQSIALNSDEKTDASVLETQSAIESDKKNCIEVSPKANKEVKTEKEKTEEGIKSGVKRGLPKWMVEDANAPPSPSEEQESATKKENDLLTNTDEADKAENPQDLTPTRGRGRGRGRVGPNTPAVANNTKSEAGSSKTSSTRDFSPPCIRPRRCTRAKIDYANPDAATVIAEVDDEEPGGLVRGGARGRGGRAGAGRSKKRKAAGSESEEEDLDEDGSSDYGSKKKKGPTGALVGTGGGRRGRPSGAKAKSTNESKKRITATGRGRGGRKVKNALNNKESDEDDDGEVIYDDQESNNEAEDSPMEEENAATPSKPAAAVSKNIPATIPKKRVRGLKAAIETGSSAEEAH